MTQFSLDTQHKADVITHNKSEVFDFEVCCKRLESNQNLALSLDYELELLEGLLQFDLGRFLLQNKGLNGYWTAYLILHGPHKTHLHPLEEWLLWKAPVMTATRERFSIFQQQLKKYLQTGIQVASIPCGLMDDCFSCQDTIMKEVGLVGIDLDEESLKLAKQNAIAKGFAGATFMQKDAWHLDLSNQFDVILSNGLNIYEPDHQKLIKLYQEFFQALKPGGMLITSFLTPPPTLSNQSTWKNFDATDLLKQRALFVDIIQTKWQTFWTEDQMKQQLNTAGFQVVEIIYDAQGMFPTVVAQKTTPKK